MHEHPILFSNEMVRSILDGRKTMTRRIIKPQPDDGPWPDAASHIEWSDLVADTDYYVACGHCPYGKIDDLLWVKEGFRFGHAPNDEEGQGIALYADNSHQYHPDLDPARFYWCREYKKRSSIFMPRWASRITLRITGVRAERLQDISEEDICAELGCAAQWTGPGSEPYRRNLLSAFCGLWDSINGKRAPWDSNPWVWVVSFEVLTKEESCTT